MPPPDGDGRRHPFDTGTANLLQQPIRDLGWAARRHLRQNAGVSTTSTVSSSRRPSSIVTEHTQV